MVGTRAVIPVGFDAFAQRVPDHPPERVAQITGVDAGLIAAAARLYAISGPAVIPWSPITDQQVSSTSAIRLQCALRAITGNIDIKGGERFVGFNPGLRSDTELELHHLLSDARKSKSRWRCSRPWQPAAPTRCAPSSRWPTTR